MLLGPALTVLPAFHHSLEFWLLILCGEVCIFPPTPELGKVPFESIKSVKELPFEHYSIINALPLPLLLMLCSIKSFKLLIPLTPYSNNV